MPRMPARLSCLAGVLLLAACSSAPVAPSRPSYVPPPAGANAPAVTATPSRPAFGSPEFNALRDAPPDAPVDLSQVPDAVPDAEPLAKYGNQSPYTVLGETYHLLPSAKGFVQTGRASWYGKKFHGMKTSSGELYDMYKMTAAHRTLPLPTFVRVTNLDNGRTAIVKVNDRGPFHADRIMDLSYAAASKLGVLRTGTANVRIEAIDPVQYQAQHGQPAKALPPPAAAAAAPVDDDAPHFFVQIGAFGNPANASALQAKLLDLVYAPVMIASSADLNRVQVGPFFTREDADKVSEIIRKNDLGTPIIVKR